MNPLILPLISALVLHAADIEDPNHTDVSLFPVVAYDSDDGFGLGVIGGVFWRQAGIAPYKLSLQWLLYATTKLTQDHYVYVDALRVADLPLRIIAIGEVYSTRVDTYCGLGDGVTCSDALARQIGTSLGYTGDALSDFAEHYYMRRYLAPGIELKARWQFTELPNKIEGLFSYRGTYYVPGEFGDLHPYPNSLFVKDYPDAQPGYVSIFQLGVMYDTRDNEPAPNSGIWLEASARLAAPALGSHWLFGGFNTTLRGYLPFGPEQRFVLANRLVGDLILGDAPVVELAEFGGTTLVPGGMTGYGGIDDGRGIRVDRYPGAIKIVEQLELRVALVSFTVVRQNFDIGVVALADVGWIGVSLKDFGGDPRHLLMGEGLGLRVAWDKNFVIRADVAVSAVEDFYPQLYITVNNTF